MRIMVNQMALSLPAENKIRLTITLKVFFVFGQNYFPEYFSTSEDTSCATMVFYHCQCSDSFCDLVTT